MSKIDEFVWVQRDGMWVKKYPTSWKGYKEPYTKGTTTKSKIDILTFNQGGYVKKDKHGKPI
jgi:hypothetical protein